MVRKKREMQVSGMKSTEFGDMEQNASVHPSGSVQSEGDGRSVVYPACRAHPFCVPGGDAVDAGGE